jgi:predicted TIM-barrel fold metal-dependent hydrolase
MIVDVHTHAFPDAIAGRAMAQLQAETDEVKAVLGGTVGELLGSMDRAGVEVAVVASIATRPEQFESILKWSAAIRSERILPFPSVHPASRDPAGEVRRIAAEGFHGLKLHPYYQRCRTDEARLDPMYAAAQESGLAVLLHAGFDLAFPRDRVADPAKVAAVLDRFPGLRVIAAHLGSWRDWDEVERHLVGRDVYLDISCSFDFMANEQARRILEGHRMDRLLFGSDSPWMDQGRTIAQLRGFGLDREREERLFGGNAAELLGLQKVGSCQGS